MESRKIAGFILGPALFLIAFFSPILKNNPGAHNLFAIFLLIVVMWVTECIPIPVTSLLAPVLITVFNIASVKDAFAPFANPIIMLFLGSFILARAMCVHGLDQKLAYTVLSMRSIAHKKNRILFAMGLISVFLSLWISNTACTAMMYPIALGIMGGSRSFDQKNREKSFGLFLLLMLAYSASIGGIGTPIGSPPNLIAMGMLEKLTDYQITFFQWMMLGSIILVPMYLFLYVFMRVKSRKTTDTPKSLDADAMSKLHADSRLTKAQKNVLFAFSVTVFLWTFPGIVSLIWGREAPLYLWFRAHFPEAAAAIIGACLLFLLPVKWKRGEFTLSFREAVKVDWGTLLLFGGGLSLGFQMFETGLAEAIGNFFISLGGDSASLAVISLLAITFSVFITELTSNTASANMIIPIIIAICQAASVNPLPPVIGSAMGCSFAFMLPVATPPNAIIYGSGLIRIHQMIRNGFWLNIAGIIIIWTCMMYVAPFLGLI